MVYNGKYAVTGDPVTFAVGQKISTCEDQRVNSKNSEYCRFCSFIMDRFYVCNSILSLSTAVLIHL